MMDNNNITILAAGKGWIVIEKPEGVSVHNEPGCDIVSFVSRKMVSDDKSLMKLTLYSKYDKISPIHRLDRETSGVMILGFKRNVTAWFSKQFEERRVLKKYLAIVHGHFDSSSSSEFFWDFPLSMESSGRKKVEGFGKKVTCKTKVEIIEKSDHYSLLACAPLTGRIHQIRRHAAMSGHPVIGDERYGSKRAVNFLRKNGLFKRLGLHSHALTLLMPESNIRETFISPCPETFIRLIKGDKTIE